MIQAYYKHRRWPGLDPGLPIGRHRPSQPSSVPRKDSNYTAPCTKIGYFYGRPPFDSFDSLTDNPYTKSSILRQTYGLTRPRRPISSKTWYLVAFLLLTVGCWF